MIYELSLVTKSDIDEQSVNSVKEIVHSVIKEYEGGILIDDDWGKVTFAQPTESGDNKGHFLYFIYEVNSAATNTELIRRFKINELVLRQMIIKKGDTSERESIVKAYKTPFSKTYNGSQTDSDNEDQDSAPPKKFSRSRSCWFKQNGISADWKDPATYTWMLNEFGKISPARVSGASRRHQRLATLAIKRARQIGVASYVSSNIARV